MPKLLLQLSLWVNTPVKYDDKHFMPETNTNTKPDKKIQNPIQFLTAPPAVLLRFRKPLIVLTHILAFVASLMLSFLVCRYIPNITPVYAYSKTAGFRTFQTISRLVEIRRDFRPDWDSTCLANEHSNHRPYMVRGWQH